MPKLKDEALEKVSGGAHYYTEPSYCIYCQKNHLMKMNNSTSITYKRVKYNTCKQYYCDLHTRFFFLVTDSYRTQFYLTDSNEVKHMYLKYGIMWIISKEAGRDDKSQLRKQNWLNPSTGKGLSLSFCIAYLFFF